MRRSELKEKVKKGSRLEISKTLAKRVKRVFRTRGEGTTPYEYALMKDYISELVRTNPGTTAILEVYPTEDGTGERFRRLYICIEAVKRGFKEGCRKIIGIDGCFLKTNTNGQMLTAIGRDGNDQMYPIGWAIVDIENKDNWLWFLGLMKDDLEINNESHWVIQSDQQKGLIPALKIIMPYVGYRLCARHILTNWQKKHPGDVMKFKFWACADTYTKRDFLDHLEKIAHYPHAKEHLLAR